MSAGLTSGRTGVDDRGQVGATTGKESGLGDQRSDRDDVGGADVAQTGSIECRGRVGAVVGSCLVVTK